MQAERSDDEPRGPRVDSVALARTVKRLVAAGHVPWLHQEVARRMSDRLQLVRRSPTVLVDWSGPLGASTALLQSAYPQARHLAVQADGEAAHVAAPRPWWMLGRKGAPVVQRLPAASMPAGEAGLLWSNMALHAWPDPQAVFKRWQRSMAVDSFLMFSTLGPGSLPELRQIHQRHRWGEPMLPFVDMHDLGDMLVQAGFADPVMDQELVTLTWADADALLAELRGLGANVSPRRFAGLRTPRWAQRLKSALLEQSAQGRPALTFEVVYGHAFNMGPRVAVQSETSVSLDDMRSMVRLSRR
jgi:malonyl-CoA O-methyltransferase